jgi:hypothetical protein
MTAHQHSCTPLRLGTCTRIQSSGSNTVGSLEVLALCHYAYDDSSITTPSAQERTAAHRNGSNRVKKGANETHTTVEAQGNKSL